MTIFLAAIVVVLVLLVVLQMKAEERVVEMMCGRIHDLKQQLAEVSARYSDCPVPPEKVRQWRAVDLKVGNNSQIAKTFDRLTAKGYNVATDESGRPFAVCQHFVLMSRVISREEFIGNKKRYASLSNDDSDNESENDNEIEE